MTHATRPARPLAAGLVAVCVWVTVFLGALFTHQGGPGGLDRAIDVRIRANLGGHPGWLDLVAGIGDPATVTVLTVALIVACLATRRWHGAVLVAVAVPLASALTELLLKPLIDRTMQGALSYPSGHSTGVFALAGVGAVLLTGPSRPGRPAAARVPLTLIAYLAASAVAVALIGLGAHYFTDTVAGAAVGTAVVLVPAFVLDRLGRPTPAPQAAAGQPVKLGGEPPRSDRQQVRVVADVGYRVVHQDQRNVAWAKPLQLLMSPFEPLLVQPARSLRRGPVVGAARWLAHESPNAARPTWSAVLARMTASSQGDQYSA